ncbi:lamin tail domain-containing protein [Chryseobacterium sp. JM1]|uniref:lamin tail domain-containing protein n=1 Tax=Chryseobacterium sp. JM1 TaxID=1233950 RepID=UPI0004E6178E|nr:lamin tail domain-containing protein [Chryseobacterium sp. JM1]KFF23009.1 nuclease [Chryseobacterium sp. JM1]
MKKIFTVLGLISATAFMNAQIVINEVYGGGSGGAAVYINDYVELINLGSSAATLSNATLQYASATGTFNTYATLPAAITLAPGQKYLIEMVPSTPNTAGQPLPTADFRVLNNTSFTNGNVFSGGFNMAAGSGKIVLATGAVQVSSPTSANVVDFVGYGSATMFEGTAAAPTPDATTSVTRNGADTNNNAADFTKTAPTPQNTTSGSLAVSDVKNAKAGNFIKNTFVKSDEITFGADVKDLKVYNMFGQVVKSASVKQNGTVNVSELAKGNYIVTGTVNNEPVSQKILKD